MTRSTAGRLQAFSFASLMAGTIAAHADTIVLPTFDVVATTPLGGGEIDVTKVPGAVWQTSAQEIQTFNDTTVTETLARQTPGVTVGNVSGNDFQPNVSYRGFDATPVTGTPIGLAVYQNGVRINEAFGDTVNWDLIPENAIDKMTNVAGNPIFGLNALGGAHELHHNHDPAEHEQSIEKPRPEGAERQQIGDRPASGESSAEDLGAD